MISFLKKFNIICDEQFGFREQRSTSDAILRFTDSVFSMPNDGQFLIAVLLDFSKAFDTVDHTILQN